MLSRIPVVGAVYDRIVDVGLAVMGDLFCIAEEVYAEDKSWCKMLREVYRQGADYGTVFIEEEQWKTSSSASTSSIPSERAS